jgi:hypothetical protein
MVHKHLQSTCATRWRAPAFASRTHIKFVVLHIRTVRAFTLEIIVIVEGDVVDGATAEMVIAASGAIVDLSTIELITAQQLDAMKSSGTMAAKYRVPGK